MSNTIDQQFVEYIVKTLVNNPDKVRVDRSTDERGVLLNLVVDPSDTGRVIGRAGATAQSLRTLLRALGTKNQARYNLKITDSTEKSENPASNAEETASSAVVASDPVSASSDSSEPDETAQDDLALKTRAELAELDDLEI